MITRDVLEALVEDDILTSRMPDVALLTQYLKDGYRHGRPICMSFGETWSEVPPGLAARVRSRPRHAHGYQLSMYGLPKLRRAVRDWLSKDNQLEGVFEPGRDFEVAVTWTGTRSAMFDFGRLLCDRSRPDSRTPVAIAAGPSWDYEGVLSPLGYRVRYHHLRPENAFRPSFDDVLSLVSSIAGHPQERLALVVINAQHNPSAVNWDAEFVRLLVRLAIEKGAALLIDDAYFSVHDDGMVPTSSLDILLRELRDLPPGEADRCPWLAVRSLGKQFHCNGWGLGAMVAAPDTLDVLVNRYRLHNSLMYGGIHQSAMADWLRDSESRRFLHQQQVGYAEKRRMVGETFRSWLGYPENRFHAGNCTSYAMFALPEEYASLPDGGHRFKLDCFRDTGVLFAPAWPWPHASPETRSLPYMRMFLGANLDEIQTAITRMVEAGFHYDRRRLSRSKPSHSAHGSSPGKASATRDGLPMGVGEFELK